MVGVAVEKSVKSILDSDIWPDVVAFLSEASSSARSSSSDFRPPGDAGSDGATTAGGAVNSEAGAATGDAAAVLGLAMVIPSSTKSSEPDDGPDAVNATGGAARPGAVGVSSDA